MSCHQARHSCHFIARFSHLAALVLLLFSTVSQPFHEVYSHFGRFSTESVLLGFVWKVLRSKVTEKVLASPSCRGSSPGTGLSPHVPRGSWRLPGLRSLVAARCPFLQVLRGCRCSPPGPARPLPRSSSTLGVRRPSPLPVGPGSSRGGGCSYSRPRAKPPSQPQPDTRPSRFHSRFGVALVCR